MGNRKYEEIDIQENSQVNREYFLNIQNKSLLTKCQFGFPTEQYQKTITQSILNKRCLNVLVWMNTSHVARLGLLWEELMNTDSH